MLGYILTIASSEFVTVRAEEDAKARRGYFAPTLWKGLKFKRSHGPVFPAPMAVF